MNCDKCAGIMRREIVFSDQGSIPMWICFCGRAVDPVVMKNQDYKPVSMIGGPRRKYGARDREDKRPAKARDYWPDPEDMIEISDLVGAIRRR